MRSGVGVLLGVVILLCLAAAGCDTKNLGTGYPRWNWWLVFPTATFSADTTWNAFETATLALDWVVVDDLPISIQIDMGGGVVEAPNNGTAATGFSQTFTLVEGGPYTWTVTFTDSNNESDILSGTYTVGPSLNHAPTIEAVAYNEWSDTLTVTVADADGDAPLTVNVTDVTGLYVGSNHLEADSSGVAVFMWGAEDASFGGTGDTQITVTDGQDTSPVTTQTITVEPIDCGPNSLAALGAAPLQTTAAVGEAVTVIVFAGDFPAAAAFNYMASVCITVEDGGDYVDDTFNVGAIGGAQKDVDGIWADMSPAPSTFFLPENYMMKAADVKADSSLDFMGFNVTPIGAGEVTWGGYLFNFGMAFDHAGAYHLGFLEFQDVKRTYYSDNAGTEFNWADISNDIPDVPNSVTVTE